MAGQVVRIDVYRKRATIDLVSAGDEQVVTCAPIVYLEATVIGDISGHTFEWVQMTGTPTVTLIAGGTPLQAYYIVGANVGGDKIFRFYIDRDTQIEQYADVVIRTTPSTSVPYTEVGVCANESLAPAGVYSSALQFDADFTFNPIAFTSEGKLVTDSLTLTWSAPLFVLEPDSDVKSYYMAKYQGSIIQEWNNSSWVTAQVYTATEQREYVLTSSKRLRQGNLFSFLNTGNTAYFNQWQDIEFSATGNVIRGKEAIGDIELGVGGVDASVARTVYVLSNLNPVTASEATEIGIVTNDYAVARTVYTITEVPISYNLSQFENGIGGNDYTITRTSGGVVGG